MAEPGAAARSSAAATGFGPGCAARVLEEAVWIGEMSKPDYGAKVDVFRRSPEAGLEPVADLQGVRLAHAVQTVIRNWSPLSQNDAFIATAKGFLRSREIHDLYARPDRTARSSVDLLTRAARAASRRLRSIASPCVMARV